MKGRRLRSWRSALFQAETDARLVRWPQMIDAAAYFIDHARDAVRKARHMPRGSWRERQRRVARVYHLLAKQMAPDAKVARVEDFRKTRTR
jgi:hypothetical protein